MHHARIAELLQPFLSPPPNHCHSEPGRRPGEEPAVLSPSQLQHISTYIDILLRWNVRINLTAIRNEEEIVTRHFGESLFAARHLFPISAVGSAAARRQNAAHGASRGSSSHPGGQAPEGRKTSLSDHGSYQGTASGRADKSLAQSRALAPEDLAEARSPKAEPRLADLGSGAGFPGIPIKLWAPHIALTLIESNHRKAAFLREVARSLTLTDINIQNARAENVALTRTFDVVTLRAVERFSDILPIAASLMAPTASLALLIAAPQSDTARSILPKLTWQDPIPIPESKSRLLLIGIQNHNSD